MNKWKIYEKEKSKLIELNLTSEEYDKKIRELLEKLNL